ncbi:MAG: M1 family metallopeptidase [Ignavibacteriales bacterium]|nr:M1 family metallopeptidase [Ignavibacteriales bacterium]
MNYEFTLDLPDTGRSIEGYAAITLVRTAPATSLKLDLLKLRVETVWVNGRAVRFKRDSAAITIQLPNTSAADTFSVAVRYGGRVEDGLIIRTDNLGRWTGFGDNFPDRGRNWLPTVDHPSDKATVTWIVRAPSDRKIVANGELNEEIPLPVDARFGTKPRTLTRWRESKPLPVYLMVIAAAPLVEYDLGNTALGLSEFPVGVRQSVYSASEQRDFLPGPFAKAGAIVEFYAKTFGVFPYEKLAHLQSSTRFGGMENASAIFYSDGSFRRHSLSEGTVAHEIAHQWFGDAVTEREWGHLWLSEGFATYCTQLWFEHNGGDSVLREGMNRIRREITSNAVVAQRPVLDTAQTDLLALLNANSYQKGGFVLHMLRSLVGDKAFFAGIRSFYEKYRHGNALTDDLRTEVEATSGKKLDWFFDQWLRRPGFIELSTHWDFDAKSKQVIIDIAQGDRFAPYRFPLTVEIYIADGKKQNVTVEIPAQKNFQARLPVESAPAKIIFDPDVKLLATFKER